MRGSWGGVLENNALTGSMSIRTPGGLYREPKHGGFWSDMRGSRLGLRTDSLHDKAEVGGQEPPIRFS